MPGIIATKKHIKSELNMQDKCGKSVLWSDKTGQHRNQRIIVSLKLLHTKKWAKIQKKGVRSL